MGCEHHQLAVFLLMILLSSHWVPSQDNRLRRNIVFIALICHCRIHLSYFTRSIIAIPKGETISDCAQGECQGWYCAVDFTHPQALTLCGWKSDNTPCCFEFWSHTFLGSSCPLTFTLKRISSFIPHPSAIFCSLSEDTYAVTRAPVLQHTPSATHE